MSLSEKLSSRKLWIAFAVIVLTAFSSHFGLEMDLGQWLTLGLATLGYSLGQGWVDAAAAKGSSAPSVESIDFGDMEALMGALSSDYGERN